MCPRDLVAAKVHQRHAADKADTDRGRHPATLGTSFVKDPHRYGHPKDEPAGGHGGHAGH